MEKQKSGEGEKQRSRKAGKRRKAEKQTSREKRRSKEAGKSREAEKLGTRNPEKNIKTEETTKTNPPLVTGNLGFVYSFFVVG